MKHYFDTSVWSMVAAFGILTFSSLVSTCTEDAQQKQVFMLEMVREGASAQEAACAVLSNNDESEVCKTLAHWRSGQ